MTLSRRGRSHLVLAAFAAAIALTTGISPSAARPVAAASDPLRTEAHATYVLDPDAGRVHVSIVATETNLKAPTAQFIYYYTSFGFALQPEAKNVKVTPADTTSISTKKRDGYVEATVRVGRAVYYRKSTTFTIRYDLVGAAPRSTAPTRIGKAFATFGVWAWGDPGRGSVIVRTPAGFENEIHGDAMSRTSGTTGQILQAKPATPAEFFAVIDSDNRDAYEETRLSFDGGVEIVVKAWPEDDEWSSTVADTLRAGLPTLRELVGLDWPVHRDLDVLERYTPALEGYAGFFMTEAQRIEISEDLDPVVIMHEASHAWFDQNLFSYRWIYEGLAEEYAWRVQEAVGGKNVELPKTPDKNDTSAVALNIWTFPQVQRDDTSDAELYGYHTSFWVIHLIVETAGEEQMRTAFANAAGNYIAYQGRGEPEHVNAPDDWRRLLDLTEPLDKPDPEPVIQAMKDYVLGGISLGELSDRLHARDDYRELLADPEGWLPPWYIREPMGRWLFSDATKGMEEATELLGLRDEVATAADALGLETGTALKDAYESARTGFEEATQLATDQMAALSAIDDARTMVDATPDLLTQVGLIGETPGVPYEAARTAFEAGDLAVAVSQAGVAAAVITGAAAIGQQRIIVAVGVTVVSILLLLLVFLLLRRRRRRRALAGITGAELLALDAHLAPAPAGVTEPSDTLAATPDPAPALAPPPLEAADPPEREGGEPL